MFDSARLAEAVRRHPLALQPDGLTPERAASIRAEYAALGRERGALTATQLAALMRIMELVKEARR